MPKPEKAMQPHPDHIGHRERLKTRFKTAGATALADYELLELLLTYAIPRKDVKPIAKRLLKTYGNLATLVATPAAKLATEKGLGTSSALFLNLLHATMVHTRETETVAKDIIQNRLQLIDYLYAKMSTLPREEFHVLYLDSKNHILAHEVLFTGTINASAVYPREVMKIALDKGATGLVLAHNHPSGNPTPSSADEELTLHINQLATGMSITLHDHFIIGNGAHYSFLDGGKL